MNLEFMDKVHARDINWVFISLYNVYKVLKWMRFPKEFV